MNTYEYDNSGIDSLSALYKACHFVGLADANVTKRGDFACITTTGTELLADDAIALAQPSTVFDHGNIKILAIHERTDVLNHIGLAWTRPSDSLVIEGVSSQFETSIQYKIISDSLAAGDVVVPIPIATINGDGFTLNTVADGLSLYLAASARVDYIRGAHTNGDSSKGEALMFGLIQAAMAADDQIALDAIVDTRV